nr:MAG TPA: hypothetical protein [Caudoviricetes sp.]
MCFKYLLNYTDTKWTSFGVRNSLKDSEVD